MIETSLYNVMFILGACCVMGCFVLPLTCQDWPMARSRRGFIIASAAGAIICFSIAGATFPTMVQEKRRAQLEHREQLHKQQLRHAQELQAYQQ